MDDGGLAAQLNELESKNRELQARLSEMVLSKSWRLTAPLRGVFQIWSAFYGLWDARPAPEMKPNPELQPAPEPEQKLQPEPQRDPKLQPETEPDMEPQSEKSPQLSDRETEQVNFIRATGRFEENFYPGLQEAHQSGLDPIRHYLSFGEVRDYAPAHDFEPHYYRERHPDVAAAGVNCFLHYLQYGIDQHRQSLPTDTRITFPQEKLTCRGRVLLMVHDASRTGAPILAWNLVRKLKARHDVVVLLRRGGELVASFEQVASAVIQWPKDAEEHPVDIRRLVQKLVAIYRPSYAIANSAETRLYVQDFENQGVPVVALVHEFAEYMRPVGTLDQLYNSASAIVFPADIVAQSSYGEYPALYEREVHIMPQGPCQIPRFSGGRSEEVQQIFQMRDEHRFLVVGMGAVHFRKGTDLFVTIASWVRRLVGDRATFLWVGQGYDPNDDVAYSAYLRDQINRFDLASSFQFSPLVDNLEPIYSRASLFLMSSRLDPLPNVALDAALRGLPLICFDQASGMAELMKAREETRDMVVPYLDCGAAALAISEFVLDGERLRQRSNAIRAFAEEAFDMDRYVEVIDSIGRRLSANAVTKNA